MQAELDLRFVCKAPSRIYVARHNVNILGGIAQQMQEQNVDVLLGSRCDCACLLRPAIWKPIMQQLTQLRGASR